MNIIIRYQTNLQQQPDKQGRIVHRSGLNNENNKFKIKNSLESKMKFYI